MTYNGTGQRVTKSEKHPSGDLTKRYIYEYNRVILEVDEAGRETARNIHGHRALSRKSGGYFVIDRDTEGLKAGENVTVHLFR